MTGKILWQDKPPTEAELAEMRRAEYQAAVEARDRMVKAALAEEADPLFFKWQRDEVDRAEWLAKVAEVKARFPVPEVLK